MTKAATTTTDAGGDGAPPPPQGLDPRVRTAIKAVAVAAATLSMAALAFFGPTAALSVAIGGGIAAANLWVLARIIGLLFPAGSEAEAAAAAQAQSRAGWTLVALLKMLGLVAVVWLLMRHGVVSPLPMLVGFGAMPIGIAIGSLVSDRGALKDQSS